MTGLGGRSPRVPLKQRPRFWWDALSVWAGIVVGLVWLAYSAVRGFPHLRALNLSSESGFDFLPALVILAVPVGMFILRRTFLAKVNLFLLRFNSVPSGKKIGMLALVIAGGWFISTTLRWVMTKSTLFNMREGLDIMTPLAMILIPMLLVFFRRETDSFLRPLQVVLRVIPRILLTLIALAVPFFLGYWLYEVVGFSQYSLLRWNVILGVLVSYALLRVPQGTNRPAGPVPAATAILIGTAGLVLADLLLGQQSAYADDFEDDPFNLNDGLRTTGAAQWISGTAGGLGVLGVNGVEIVRNLTGASGAGDGSAHQPDRTQLLSGDRALQWLRDNGFIDGNNRFTPDFQEWYDRLPSDNRPTDLHGIAGEFDPAGGQVPEDLTIAVTDHSKPPGPVIDDTRGTDTETDKSERDEKTDTDTTGQDDGDKQPPEVEKPPKPPTQPVVPPEPPESPEPEPDDTTPPESVPPVTPPPPKPQPDTEANVPDMPPKLDDKQFIDLLNQMSLDGSNQADIIKCAGFGGGVSLSDISNWLYRQGDRIRAPFENFIDWYKNKWLKNCEATRITDKHRLPDRIIKRGLFDTSRDSALSQGVRQSMINAGVKPEVADAVIKKIEAEGAEDAQIARLGTKLLRNVRALNQGLQANVEGGPRAGLAAAGHDIVGPDPTAIVERMVLTQQSNYQNAVDRWRDTQSVSRWAQTGGGVTGPQTQQDVDKLLSDLRSEQRDLKKQLGYDMNKMRNNEDMRRMWKEEKALKDLRNECADLNLLKRLKR